MKVQDNTEDYKIKAEFGLDLILSMFFSPFVQGEPGSAGVMGLPGLPGRGLAGQKVTIRNYPIKPKCA